jgi:methylmalonyl-CoA/ethylmalonyl-CoA epimerase
MIDPLAQADPPLRFHHVGVACTNIEEEAARLASLGYVSEGAPFVDPVQGIRGLFVSGQSPRLELLEPLAPGGVLQPWLDSETKLYHLAYETPDLDASLARLRKSRAKLVVAPVAAVAFGGRYIAFVMLPNRLLVELIAMA